MKKTIAEIIQLRKKEQSNETALMFADYNQQVSFGQLADSVSSYAEFLVHNKICQGKKIALLAKDCRKTSLVYLACAWIGSQVVVLDPDAGRERLDSVFTSVPFDLLICEQAYAALIQGFKGKVVFIEEGSGIHQLPLSAQEYALKEIEVTASPEDDLILLNTSGSTGNPKVVRIHHEAIIVNALAVGNFLKIGPNDRFLSLTPTTHAHGFYNGLLMPLIIGASSVMIDAMTVFHAPKFWSIVNRNRVTVCNIVPTIVEMLLSMKIKPLAGENEILRFFICGTAPLNEQSRKSFEKACSIPVLCQYGLTETLINSIEPLEGNHPEGSVGKPLDNNISLEDNEIIISGASVTHGYFNQPELTDQVLKGGRFYTGDLGRFDKDGFLYIIGRKKDIIIKGGKNILASDVERVLSKHSAVHEAAVVGLPDDFYGEEVFAAVVLKENTPIEEIISFSRESLAAYQVPKAIFVVKQFMRGPTGKPLKNEIKKLCQEQWNRRRNNDNG